MEITRIPLVNTVRFGGRTVDTAAVKLLAESMAAVGLLNAITVIRKTRQDGPTAIDTYWIVAGKHRVQAARDLGWTEIDAVIVDMDAVHAELCEIDENLIRSELTDSQRAAAHARREAIMVSLGLVAVPGRGGDRSNEQKVHSYSKQAAESLGIHEKTVRKDLARGKKIAPDVLAEVSGSALDKGVVLDELAATPREDQRAKLAKIQQQRSQVRPAPDPLNDPEAHEKQLSALMAAWNRAAAVVGQFEI